MELIAQGRDADVFALDRSRVLRRYRNGGPTVQEARLMAYVRARGYPVPAVYAVSPTDMVLERLAGPTMLDVLARQPWRARTLGRWLGSLHDELHALPAPTWLPTRFGTAGDDRVLHLDLHPGNVILTGRGPVVIDWRNAAAGDPAADVATTVLTLGSVEMSGFAARRARGLLVRGVRRGSRTDPAARMREVAVAKSADPNATSAEAAWLRRQADTGTGNGAGR